MKELWNNYKRWVHYMLDYKDNIEYLDIKEGEVSEKSKRIEELKKQLEEKNIYIQKLEEKIKKRKKKNK